VEASKASAVLRRRVALRMAGLGGLLLCVICTTSARAEMVLVSDTTLVIGTQSQVFSFIAPGPGTVSVQLANLNWPQPLSTLSFMAGSANQVLASWSDPSSQPTPSSKTLYFQVAQGGTYFADVAATAGGPLDLGVYSLSVQWANPPSPVPLPASDWLLAAGIVVLIGLLPERRRRRTIETCQPFAAP